MYALRMALRGLLVVHEGPDGSGKETQTALLGARLRAGGVRVARYDFPTYGADPTADLIRTMLRTMQEEWNARAWESKALLYAANRARFRDQVFARLAEPGTVVVCNRYVPSNQAHMAGIVDDPAEWERRFEWIAHLEYDSLRLPRPDIVILHTMPRAASDGLLQVRERGAADAHESDSAYLARVERCYHALAAREPAVWRRVPADRGKVLEPPDAVHARVWEALAAHPAWQAFARAPAVLR